MTSTTQPPTQPTDPGIAQRQQLEQALQESEARFREVFDHASHAVFVIDPARNAIVDANPRACSMLGYPREELLSLPVSAIHPNEMPELMAFGQAVFADGHGSTDKLTCLTKRGRFLSAVISASVIELASQPYLMAVVRDTSGRT